MQLPPKGQASGSLGSDSQEGWHAWGPQNYSQVINGQGAHAKAIHMGPVQKEQLRDPTSQFLPVRALTIFSQLLPNVQLPFSLYSRAVILLFVILVVFGTPSTTGGHREELSNNQELGLND